MNRLLAFALFFFCISLQAQQPGRTHRVGVLVASTTPSFLDVFRATLKELGHAEGVNVVIDMRVAGDRLDLLSTMAGEIVKASPDVIVAVNTPGTAAAMAATKSIPIVMVAVGDPVGSGFVRSLARPDGNVTGVTNLCGELAGKRLAIFRETLPKARRIAVVFNSGDPITQPQVRDAERTAPSLGVELRFFPVRTSVEMDSSFDALLKWRANGVMWLCGQHRGLTQRMLPLAAKHRVPVMVAGSDEVEVGGLMSYSTDNADLFRRAAAYVDKILKGAKVGSLPVEQPTKFELALNLRVAAALGVPVPQSILLRADKLIK